MQKRFEAIQPGKLSEVWPLIREEVASIETPDNLIPEDVYFACKANSATLFLLHVDNVRIGWLVLRLIEPDLHIWQLHAEPGFDVMRLFRDELMDVARRANARMLTYGSMRKAWQKIASEHGFTPRMTVYECPIDSIGVDISGERNNSPVAAA